MTHGIAFNKVPFLIRYSYVDKEQLLLLRTFTVDYVRDSKDRSQTKGGSPIIAWISLFLEIGSRNKKAHHDL